ncbi:MAG: vitamin K epoxide reductase family protein [Gemmatimonadaceae bacterium]
MSGPPADSGKEVVIVTGSSGLIGSAILARLSASYRGVGFDRAGDSRPKSERVECICVDVTSDESVMAGLERVRYAYGDRIASFIHLAAYYDFSGAPSRKYDEVTVRGTQRVLRALQEFDVGQFVFSSTILVHAPSPPGERLNENSPLDPKWPYPKSKVETEKVILQERGHIPVVILRIAGVYDDRCHSIPLAHEIQRIYERQFTNHFFPGDVTQGRQSFVHLDDLTSALANTLEQRMKLPGEFTALIGESEALSYAELQEKFGCLIHGTEWETIKIPEKVAEAGAWLQENNPLGDKPFIKPWMVPLADDDFVLDTTRAQTMLNWRPQHSLSETIPSMVDALEADPLKWYGENHLEAPSWLKEKETAAAAASEHGEASEEPSAGHEAHGKEGHREEKLGMEVPSGETGISQKGMANSVDHMRLMMTAPSSMSPWVNPILMMLGLWLITSPATLGYASGAMVTSDIASGAVLVVLAILALSGRRGWAAWASGFVGVWLLFAPLVFWAPTAAGYLNDTLVGALVIAFAILLPMGMPMGGPDLPRGWSYNPSSWLQRAPVIALGLIGLVGARYMTAYQLGHIRNAWDPFFGDQTVRVLTSDVSHAWPISDAGLGATTYMFEVLMGLMGDKRRWRTMPWMVTFFGILVVPLGVTSIVLVIMQPVVVGAWCTICLATALAMLVMIPLTLDEVVAMAQFLVQSRREGKSFWRTFWFGGDLPDGGEDPRAGDFSSPPAEIYREMIRGLTAPWTLLAGALLGVWLMFAPSILRTTGAMADSNHLLGALIVTFAVIAWAEVVRPVRFINVLFGVWVAVSPWTLSGAHGLAVWSNAFVGGALIVSSIPRGRILQRYGTWERYIR